MALRWIYKTWSVIWSTIGVTLGVVLILGVIGFGLLQLPASKNYIVNKIESRFNSQHHGVLKLGKFTGTLPISFQFDAINLYPDSTSIQPVLSTDTVSATLDFWPIFGNRFVINGLQVSSPTLRINSEPTSTLLQAIKKRDVKSVELDSTATESASTFIEILAPSVIVNNGYVVIENPFPNSNSTLDSLTFRDVSVEMFLDYNVESRFIDFDRLDAQIPELGVDKASFYGQVFNDERYLEFNAFNINLNNSVLNFSGEADGVDLLKPDLASQLSSSILAIDVNELFAEPQFIRRVYKDFPDINQGIYLSLEAEGNVDSLWIDSFEVIFGESALNGDGYIANPLNRDQISYEAELKNVLVDSTELAIILPEITNIQRETITTSRYNVNLNGSTDSLSGAIKIESEIGSVLAQADLSLSENLAFTFEAELDSLNLGEILSDKLVNTNLSGTIMGKTTSLKDIKNALGNAEITLVDGSINEVAYDSIYAVVDWESALLNPSFIFTAPNTFLNGEGLINLTDSIPTVSFSGRGTNLDIKGLSKIENLATAIVDLEYEFNLSGTNRNNVYGQVSLDIPFSIVGGDTLPNHQFYADFNESSNNEKRLRITSTALDISMNGEYNPQELIELTPYWISYFENRIDEEFLFESISKDSMAMPNVQNQNFELDAIVKNINLIESYLPNFPSVVSTAQLNSNININADRILFNSTILDPSFNYTNIQADSVSIQLTGSFRHSDKISALGGLQAAIEVARLETEFFEGYGLETAFSMDEPSMVFSQSISKIGEDTRFDLVSYIQLQDSSINVTIDNFELGSETYKWQNNRKPLLSYLPNKKLQFSDFTFSNLEEFISVDGALSNSLEDSVKYIIRSVDLGRISNLINGRIDFSGNLDGSFTTKALNRIPTIQGELNIFELGVDDNVVGDVTVQSFFNQDLNRFDSNISILTDSTKYPEYFIQDERVGQNIELEGYILAPINGQFPSTDSLFYFDLDFENIDLWIIPFIAPKVFTEMSGKATGDGYVWGNLETYDFEVDYEIGMDDAVYMKPRFLDTFYYGQGMINFSRERGLDFEDVFIIDPSGGTAILSGTYNLNDFQQLHSIDLRIEMDEFQFLNNTFDPTLPFFGKAYGSSTLLLSGTNIDPILSTETPIYISDFSNIGIPLLEETEFDVDNKFIRFVDDFTFNTPLSNTSGNNQTQFEQDAEENPSTRTFTERFTLDLQIIATQPMTVQLIFDPITGDIITTNGTGRLSIRLQDEEFSMFGQFDISGGNYQFVSGDIFTRRFDLERGGTLIWDGSPTDARLNIDAVYEARPDINTLTRARADIDQETSQRVPVQLVLSIGGSLNSIENNFFFRLPNNFETIQNTTLSTQINTLNRNEDEKLIQATSFLLMGDFIPSTTATTDGTNSLTNNFSGSSAVLNPLLSSQVINPLLSNQINSLLRSDVGSLDIDFNLNTYNNVDLAVALRLYNDRIILSREGQITGAQSNIGDLGATYRINQTLSVTAFHRQDPTFSSFGDVEESQQAQDINGVGLEAEVSFNNWNEFFRRLTSPIRKLFRRKNNEREPEEVLTQNQNPPS